MKKALSCVLGLLLNLALCGAVSAEGTWTMHSYQEAAYEALTGNQETGWKDDKGTTDPNYEYGGYVMTSCEGASATFEFTGTGVRWLGATHSSRGWADVYIDGALAEEGVDQTGDLVYMTPIFEITGLAAGKHTIKIECQSGGSDKLTEISAFEVLDDGGSAAPPDNGGADTTPPDNGDSDTTPPDNGGNDTGNSGSNVGNTTTGDAGIAAFAMMGLAVAAALAVIRRRK